MGARRMMVALAVLAAALSGAGGVGAEIYDGPTLTPTTREGTAPHVIRNLRVAVSDGTELVTDVYLPTADPAGRWPVLLSMTPYVRGTSAGAYFRESKGSFARVIVSVRGTGGSGGTLCILCDREQQDLAEMVTWASEQDWSAGRVAITGSSYPAILGLLAAAKQPKGLAAVVAEHASFDTYRDSAWHNGMFNANFVAQWMAFQAATGLVGAEPWTLDETVMNKLALEARAREWDDAFYKERAVYTRYDRIVTPTLFIDGWRDGFSRGAIENFAGIASKHKRLWMDPFGHHYGSERFEPASEYRGEFVDCAGVDGIHLAMRWLKRFLLDELNGVEDEPAAEWFDMGTRSWHTAPRFPAPNAQVHALHLSGQRSGSAASRKDGSLTGPAPAAAEHQQADVFVHDPAVGTTDTFSKWGEVAVTPQIPVDQATDEARSLTYTTGALPAPMHLAGPMELRLWSTTTAPDMDWVVKVSDVAPDGSESPLDPESPPREGLATALRGTSTLMTSGFVRSSHRKVDEALSRPTRPWLSNDEPLAVPMGVPVEHRIDVWPVAWTLQPGHRLRVTISSSDVPSHEPYPVAAVNTVLHDAAHPSRLLITTVPDLRPVGTTCAPTAE